MEYSDYVKDFPRRCRKLWAEIQSWDLSDPEYDDLEVTSLICIASSAINIPLERLSTNSFDDGLDKKRDGYSESVSKLEEFESRLFSDWANEIGVSSAKFARTDRVMGLKFEAADPPSNQTVRVVLKLVRNALAHGNINYGGSGKIEVITFSNLILKSQKTDVEKSLIQKPGQEKLYHYISLSTNDFARILAGWLDFLDTLPLPVSSRDEIVEPKQVVELDKDEMSQVA